MSYREPLGRTDQHCAQLRNSPSQCFDLLLECFRVCHSLSYKVKESDLACALSIVASRPVRVGVVAQKTGPAMGTPRVAEAASDETRVCMREGASAQICAAAV